MNRETLIAKRDAITNEFEEQGKAKNNAETRQVQLQGEHRLIQELIETMEQEATASRGNVGTPESGSVDNTESSVEGEIV